MLIRPAIDADRAAIAALHIRSWSCSYRGMLPDAYLDGPMAADLHAKWTKRRFSTALWAWVAEDNGSLRGFVCIEGGRPALIDNVHVDPDHRSKGLGLRLMNTAIEDACARGHGHLYLAVLSANTRAKAFYTRMGGRVIAEQEDEVFGQPVRSFRIEWGGPSNA
ncbi:MAG: GNAT family N-acetyltransferase [Pseudomonadota bacterium]